MKNINKNVLKQLEKDKFNNEIINDPLRFAYYTALKGYNDYLSTANLEGTPQSTTKFNKYSKDLLKIMKTEAHVCYLLINELQIKKGLYHYNETRYFNTGGRYGGSRYKIFTIYKKWNNKEQIFNTLEISEMHDYIYNLINNLFPSLIFVNYKTANLKEILKLLHMQLDPHSFDVVEYTSNRLK